MLFDHQDFDNHSTDGKVMFWKAQEDAQKIPRRSSPFQTAQVSAESLSQAPRQPLPSTDVPGLDERCVSPGTPRSTGLLNPLPAGPQSHVPVENQGPPPVPGMRETIEYIPVGTVYEVRHSWVAMPDNYPGSGWLLPQPEHLGFQRPDDGQATSSRQEPRPKIAPNPEKRTQPKAKHLQQMTLGLAYLSFRVGVPEPETRLDLEKVGLLVDVQSFQNDSELTWNVHSPVKSHSYHNPSVDSSNLLGFIALKSSNYPGPLKISGRIWLCPEAEAYDYRRLVRWILAQVALQFFSHKVFNREHDVGRNRLTLPWMNENTQIEAGARNRTCSFQMSFGP